MGQTQQKGYQIRDMVGATESVAGQSGVVPAPSAGDQNKVLRGDGTWVAQGGSPFSAEVVQFTPDSVSPPVNRILSSVLRAIAFSGSADNIAYAQFTTDGRLDDTKDIVFEILYCMSSSESTKQVSLNADVYVFADNMSPAKAADATGLEDEISVPNDGNTDKLVLTNIKVAAAFLTGTGQTIVLKFWRDVDGVAANHSGDFQLISLRAYQV